MLHNHRRLQSMLKRRQEMLANTRIQLNKEQPEVDEKIDRLIASINGFVLFPEFCKCNSVEN